MQSLHLILNFSSKLNASCMYQTVSVHLLGCSRMIVVTISAHTAIITTRAITIPFQFLFCTVWPTSSWNGQRKSVRRQPITVWPMLMYLPEVSLLSRPLLTGSEWLPWVDCEVRMTYDQWSCQTDNDMLADHRQYHLNTIALAASLSQWIAGNRAGKFCTPKR